MVVRVWKARAAPGNVAAYARHFRHSVLPELAGIAGHQGALVLKHDAGAHVEVTVLTLWESMAAIEKFAGNPVGRAVVEPAARAVLIDFDETVRHYDVVHSSLGPAHQ